MDKPGRGLSPQLQGCQIFGKRPDLGGVDADIPVVPDQTAGLIIHGQGAHLIQAFYFIGQDAFLLFHEPKLLGFARNSIGQRGYMGGIGGIKAVGTGCGADVRI